MGTPRYSNECKSISATGAEGTITDKRPRLRITDIVPPDPVITEPDVFVTDNALQQAYAASHDILNRESRIFVSRTVDCSDWKHGTLRGFFVFGARAILFHLYRLCTEWTPAIATDLQEDTRRNCNPGDIACNSGAQAEHESARFVSRVRRVRNHAIQNSETHQLSRGLPRYLRHRGFMKSRESAYCRGYSPISYRARCNNLARWRGYYSERTDPVVCLYASKPRPTQRRHSLVTR